MSLINLSPLQSRKTQTTESFFEYVHSYLVHTFGMSEGAAGTAILIFGAVAFFILVYGYFKYGVSNKNSKD